MNEWTFFAPVGLIQSTSLLGAERTGISLMELIHLPAPFSSGLLSLPNRLRRLPSPAHCRRRSPGHAAFTALKVSGRRWRACALATVRRSNRTCGFPAYGFHEDSRFRDANKGIN